MSSARVEEGHSLRTVGERLASFFFFLLRLGSLPLTLPKEETNDHRWLLAAAEATPKPASCSGEKAAPPPRGFGCSPRSEKLLQ